METVTRTENGTYEWNGTVDVSYEYKTFGIVFGVCLGTCALFVLFALFFMHEILGLMLLIFVIVAAICGGVCYFFNRNAGKRKQAYSMTEDAVIFGVGKAANPFFFESIKKAVVYTNRNMVELYTRIGSAPVFVTHEDFGFVRDYIIRKLPDTAVVLYK